MPKIKRKNILFQPGPIHLFWTTGVYFIFNLIKEYNIVLLVQNEYKDNKRFNKITEIPEILEVVYYRSRIKSIGGGNRFFGSCDYLLKKYSPLIIYMHNHCYLDNQYLLSAAYNNVPDIQITFYQNGQQLFNIKEDYDIRNKNLLFRIKKRLPAFLSWLPLGVLAVFLKSHNHVRYCLDFKLNAFLVTGNIFKPDENLNTGKLYKYKVEPNYKKMSQKTLTYSNFEKKIMLLHGSSHIQVIHHPAKDSWLEVYQYLIGNYHLRDQIIILPSAGFLQATVLTREDPHMIVDEITNTWIQIIKFLAVKYPRHPIKIKLHPGDSGEIWNIILSKLSESLQLDVIHKHVAAEFLIMESTIVVGDVSSTLWWASMLGNKTVYSFDLFGYTLGEEMARYKPSLNYVNHLNYIS